MKIGLLVLAQPGQHTLTQIFDSEDDYQCAVAYAKVQGFTIRDHIWMDTDTFKSSVDEMEEWRANPFKVLARAGR